jgi:hypothetical protein
MSGAKSSSDFYQPAKDNLTSNPMYTPTTPINLTGIHYGSFLKLSAAMGAAGGLIFGLAMFIGSLVGASVKLNLVFMNLKGVLAGVAGIFFAPIMFAIFCMLPALLAYFPFRLLLRVLRGLSLNIHTH